MIQMNTKNTIYLQEKIRTTFYAFDDLSSMLYVSSFPNKFLGPLIVKRVIKIFMLIRSCKYNPLF
jgi:hypothetical protein